MNRGFSFSLKGIRLSISPSPTWRASSFSCGCIVGLTAGIARKGASTAPC